MSEFVKHEYLQKPQSFDSVKSRVDGFLEKQCGGLGWEVVPTSLKDGSDRKEISAVRIILKNALTEKETALTIAIDECPPEYPLEKYLKKMQDDLSQEETTS